jgi:hypothetical protein
VVIERSICSCFNCIHFFGSSNFMQSGGNAPSGNGATYILPGVVEANESSVALLAATGHDGPRLVDIISQPLQEANAPVSEWIA